MSSLSFGDFWAQKYATQGQYFVTRVFSQRIGAIFAYLAYRANLSPNTVTVLGLPVMLAASGCLALSIKDISYSYLALALYQVGMGLDCADGQLARGTQRTSEFGAWLDNTCDHARQMSMVLALGAILVVNSGLPLVVTGLSLFLFGSGLTIVLHTVATLKGGSFRPHGLTGALDYVKWLTKSFSDTPLVLLLICVLAQFPVLLAIYIAVIGLLNLVQGVALGVLRVR